MKVIKKILKLNLISLTLTCFIIGTFNYNVNAKSNRKNDGSVKVAVFLDNANAMYISLLKESLEKIEIKNSDKVKFTFFDAKDNQAIQNESITNALESSYDLFIVNLISPNLKDIEFTLNRIMEKNIPLILNPDPSQEIINFVKPYKKCVIIGADFEESGTLEGQILADIWKDNKKLVDKNNDNILQYVMLKGRIGSPLTYLRTKFSILALNDAGIKTEELAISNCEWLQDCAMSSVESLLLKYGNKIEAIISNNDAMAVGAVEALQKYGFNNGDKNRTVQVVGIDGMPAAKELIQKGFMAGTVVVNPDDLAEVLYEIGMNLAQDKSPLLNTKYKFNESGFTVHLKYEEYLK